MISLTLARKLKSAGLVWLASINDYFAIPDSDLDDRIFVLSDMMSFPAKRFDQPVITFHGSAEWALDYIVVTEVIWMPHEGQLRDALARYLPLASVSAQTGPPLSLTLTSEGYCCNILFDGGKHAFFAEDASEAYGKALLFVLENQEIFGG
jgi:hypothetical protein